MSAGLIYIKPRFAVKNNHYTEPVSTGGCPPAYIALPMYALHHTGPARHMRSEAPVINMLFV